ncbi:hypothetical protein D3C77_326650 [compost metagenome]
MLLTRTLLPISVGGAIFCSIKVPIYEGVMAEQLTLQAFVEGQWHDALVLTVQNEQRVPEGVRKAQSIPLNNLDVRLAEWGLQ